MKRLHVVVLLVRIPQQAVAQQEEYSGSCDKCGELVPKWNDATLIDAEATGNALSALATPRHFLPTGHCPGSPSRAQYIKGQPRDKRGYSYIPENEAIWRRAFETVKARYKKN